MIIRLTEANFEKEVSGDIHPVLVEFYASWCPRCAMMEDVLAEFSEKHREIKVGRVDTEKEILLAEKYGIEKVPCFIAFYKGRPAAAVSGTVSQNILLDMFSGIG